MWTGSISQRKKISNIRMYITKMSDSVTTRG